MPTAKWSCTKHGRILLKPSAARLLPRVHGIISNTPSQNIYTDAALEEQTGYRLVVSITDKAAYSAEYSVDMTNAELAQTDLEYNTGNFFLWIPVELSGLCVGGVLSI